MDGDEPPAMSQLINPSPIEADPAVFVVVATENGLAPNVTEKGSTPDPDPSADWRKPYLDWLVREVLPTDKTEARHVTHRAKSFVLINDELYKKGHTGILQCCIPIEQGK